MEKSIQSTQPPQEKQQEIVPISSMPAKLLYLRSKITLFEDFYTHEEEKEENRRKLLMRFGEGLDKVVLSPVLSREYLDGVAVLQVIIWFYFIFVLNKLT